jgi:hypothetical protein
MEDNQHSEQAHLQPIPPAAPKMKDLLTDGWYFVRRRGDLLKWYIVSLAVAAVLGSGYVLESGGITTFVAAIGLFVTTIYIMMNSWAILYAAVQPDDSGVTFEQAFNWSAGNFFQLIWTSLLAGLATALGLIFFVIPGVLLSVYFYFAIYAFATGSGYGTKALKRSYEAVKGRWWAVAVKLFTLSFWVLVLYLIPLLIYSIIFSYTDEFSLEILVADIFIQGVYGGVVGAMIVYALAKYYRFLIDTQNTTQ